MVEGGQSFPSSNPVLSPMQLELIPYEAAQTARDSFVAAMPVGCGLRNSLLDGFGFRTVLQRKFDSAHWYQRCSQYYARFCISLSSSRVV
jgi:hypothetical protein